MELATTTYSIGMRLWENVEMKRANIFSRKRVKRGEIGRLQSDPLVKNGNQEINFYKVKKKMPEWEDCAKIHEGCGGIVRWVEAVHWKGVGYYGECLHCGEDHLTVEEIIPLENTSIEQATEIPR